VTDLRTRIQDHRLASNPEARTSLPPSFILGVILMGAVISLLLLRSALAVAGGSSASPSPSLVAAAAGSAAPDFATVAPVPTEGPMLPGYVWPLAGPTITLPFGPSNWGEFIVDGRHFHDGIDMATFCGDNVMAAHDGTVLAASRQYDDFMGWTTDLAPYYHLLDTKKWWDSLPIVIVIDDGDGYRTVYAHESKVTVKPGQKVKAGDVIGYEGATGNASGCHVHFGLFSTSEAATFQLDPAIVARDSMPAYEVARTNPMLVLPFRCEIDDMRALRPIEARPCPQFTTPKPTIPSASGSATL
jgi:murein DD-endopeptidase MepM/ murein hydrolase activator NlpD